MRTLRIAQATVEGAIRRGLAVAEAWEGVGGQEGWQAESVEIARVPVVWRRMLEKQRRERAGAPDLYEVPRPLLDVKHRLPGYVLPGWGGAPRAGWELAHAPSNAWNGLRRNLYVSLVEMLRDQVRGYDRTAELWSRWRVVLV